MNDEKFNDSNYVSKKEQEEYLKKVSEGGLNTAFVDKVRPPFTPEEIEVINEYVGAKVVDVPVQVPVKRQKKEVDSNKVKRCRWKAFSLAFVLGIAGGMVIKTVIDKVAPYVSAAYTYVSEVINLKGWKSNYKLTEEGAHEVLNGLELDHDNFNKHVSDNSDTSYYEMLLNIGNSAAILSIEHDLDGYTMAELKILVEETKGLGK